ncbi:hypothetical protein TNCV_4613681 [Trichonephila clavipes]|nr:hypothetical protein TNCV_4613681 [Trichonephila clavipes]
MANFVPIRIYFNRLSGQQKEKRPLVSYFTIKRLKKVTDPKIEPQVKLSGYVQPIECLLSQCHGPTTAKPFRHHIDFPAKTVWKKILDLVATPPCHLRSTNKDTLTQAGPFTQGLNYKLDMGWRNASRSISQ